MPPLEPVKDIPGLTDIGLRVTLRIFEPGGGFRDLVGVLESPTSIRKRDGSLVKFAPEQIAAWRRITPPADKAGRGAPLSLRIQEIELAANATWPAKVQLALGDWTLRASGKFTMRANSVLALGDPGVPLEEAINTAVAFYQERNLTPVFHIALPTYSQLDQVLEEQGWVNSITALVMVADIEEILGESPTDFEEVGIWEIESSPSEEWISLQDDRGVLEIITSAPARYAGLRVGRSLVAVGRAANHERWTVLTRLYVDPDYRNRGIGGELIRRLLLDAATLGATKVMLQVNKTNKGAVALYESLGFRLHHTYHYRALNLSSSSGNC